MDKNLLVKITSRAWSLDILDRMGVGVAGRQAPLLAATGASRTAFAQSMGHLIDLGLVERNPGHGHPLRPEFRLTATGVGAAAMAGRILAACPEQAEVALLRRSWTVPVLTACQQPSRFSEIKRVLSPITDRALSASLKELQDRDWLCRAVDSDSHPPRSLYVAANAGLRIARAPGLRLAS
ncbi:winged helix-turn-helix transcriptional regulator [Oceanicola sp. S124]|uniref:winged helix-turn-helix transcriptional regulator n=1 Tax=Oceanicola sp. S124 TaxID=1042378 RepID=UPI00025593C6|nr:winged helix-turn-helix transcriptional regulator [Oceanicola sp. S124]